MEPERLIEIGHQGRWKRANLRTESFDRYRPDLLCLGLGVVT
jgi:hypothetical protein